MPNRRTLCFLPTILGIGAHFSKLAQMLEIEADCVTCRLPGTIAGEEPLATLEEMAAYCKAHLAVPDRYHECALVGWSFGGVLAYELARQLAAAKVRVANLVLIDAYLQSGELPAMTSDLTALHSLLDPDAASPSDADSMQSEALLRIYRANVAAMLAYAPSGYDGSLVEIRAEASAPKIGCSPSSLRPLPAAKRRVIVLPGDHYSIMAQSGFGDLAAALAQAVTLQ